MNYKLAQGSESYLPLSNEENRFPGASVVKNLPAKQEMLARSLGQKDPLEKEMVTLCSILAWEILWTEDPGGLQSMGSQKSQTQLGNYNNNK